MSPPIPVNVLLHQCWMERLHQCCHQCGEMSSEAVLADASSESEQPSNHQEAEQEHSDHQYHQRYQQSIEDECLLGGNENTDM